MVKAYFSGILLLGLFFQTIICKGQNVGGGISLGLNVSQVDGDFVGGFNKAGFSGGGYVYFDVSDRIRLQPELLFEQLGSAQEGLLIVRLSYVSLPLLVVYTLPLGSPRAEQSVHFELGPVFGYLLDSEDINGDINYVDEVDIRLSGGGRYQAGKLGIGARFGYSVKSLVGQRNGINILRPGVGGVFNHYITFSLTYRLFAPY